MLAVWHVEVGFSGDPVHHFLFDTISSWFVDAQELLACELRQRRRVAFHIHCVWEYCPKDGVITLRGRVAPEFEEGPISEGEEIHDVLEGSPSLVALLGMEVHRY